MDPLERPLENARAALARELERRGWSCEVELEKPPEGMGDAAFPCFRLAKQARKAPAAIAGELAGTLKDIEGIEKVVAEAAYVNFWLDAAGLVEATLKAVLSEGKEYGSGPAGGQKIILEHTSANPTDSLHVGRARNPIIGDTLARILRKAGYEVETQYYVDDLGNQAATLAYGVHIWPDKKEEDKVLGPYQWAHAATSGPTATYPGNEFEELARERDEWRRRLEEGDDEIVKLAAAACDEVMGTKIIPDLASVNIVVDRYVHESLFVEPTKDVVEALKGAEHAGQAENGAWFIDLEPYGVHGREPKFVFTRADGTSLYATRDVAYHQWKLRQADHLVNVLGEDHKLEAKMVAVALGILGEEEVPEVVFYAFVSLPEGKMSTRQGRVVYLRDLVSEAMERAEQEVRKRRPELDDEAVGSIAAMVGIGALRFNIIRVQAEKQIIFKWEEALNFEGSSAPFVQYAHARACSILGKAEGQGHGWDANADFSKLTHPSEVALVKCLAAFPGMVREAAGKRRAHQAAAYALEAASLFNQFYRDCPVLEGEGERAARLGLTEAARLVISETLDLLGIESPQEM